ncbi:DUF3887 domain-containing protein [Pseudoalteromonas umbrosa]|uniref:DUF3887 domain-containing protein n=1 Tax=Pseudoalteromonas umbrosa TaxID=3048489 RepID=UPI0024C3E071|nr:DUF3887 domain-containing protein [Pseudoalteromonas sp. B95]MDK1286453.1 NTF2-like N-terminal transpeptidase domain-containing protein [Pseudoalteromonas sp. B95]
MNNSSKVIILLLIANLIATIWFGTKNSVTAVDVKPYEEASKHELPSFITEQVREDILNTFIEHFNAQDFDALYNMFGPVAKSQISKEKMDEEFSKLVRVFDKIEQGTYSFAELSGQQGSTTVYVLNYTVTLSEKSTFGGAGNLKITVAVDSNSYQIYGIFLHGNSNS